MIRTKTVRLTKIPALAYRQKLQAGGSGIVLIRADESAPGIASISGATGEPIPTVNTSLKKYPLEAFKEAMDLTRGLSYRKLGSVKVTPDMFKEEKPEKEEEIVLINDADLQKITEKYTDKQGKFSYELMNKELIKFAKSSTVVKKMIEDKKSAAAIKNYVVSNKFRNISGNHDLSSKQLKKIADILDETYKKGIFKELNAEIRKLLSDKK